MKLQIERPYVEVMLEQFPGLTVLKDQLRFGNRAKYHLINYRFERS